MKSMFTRYSFIFKIAAAALLTVLGVIILINPSYGEKLVIGFSGVIVVLFAIIRFFPLLKTLKSNRSRLISFLEIAVNLVVGAVLCYVAFNIETDSSENTKLVAFVIKYYNVIIGLLLWSRGTIYTILTILYKEETDKTQLWLNILCSTLGVIVLSFNDNLVTNIALFIAVVALICALYLFVDGGIGYSRHRKQVKLTRLKEENKEKIEEAIIELPPQEEKDINEKEEIENTPIIEPNNESEQTTYS